MQVPLQRLGGLLQREEQDEGKGQLALAREVCRTHTLAGDEVTMTQLRTQGFNLAFVDGDHRFESVLDDFIRLERWAAPGALIVLHDTLPLTELTASTTRQSGFYTGDGWKIVPCLRGLRPDLAVVTLPVAPTGITLVTGLNPASTLLSRRGVDILATYAAMPAHRVVERPEFEARPLGENSHHWVRRWLNDSASSAGGR